MYVVSYDISTNKLRNKIAKTLESYGRRVQYSVFECHLTEKKYMQLYQELMKLMVDADEGSIRFYQICANCEAKIKVIGVADDTSELDELFIVV